MELSGFSEIDDVDDSSSGIWSLTTDNSVKYHVEDCSKQADAFLETQGKMIHPIFDTEDKYLEQRASPPRKKVFDQSMELHAKQFLEVMQAYQASLKDPKLSSLNLQGKHSWDDVLRVAKDAEAEYLKAGGKGLRGVGRFITAHSDAVVPYLNLIPNGEFTSILCGGLKLVFRAASRISEKREIVLKTLLRIPQVILEAEDCVATFPSDPALYDKAAEVYLAALAAIEGTTRWLTSNPSWKQFHTMAKGSLYGKTFKRKVQDLDESLVALQLRVSTLRDGAIVRTEHVVERIGTVLDQTRETGEVVNTTTRTTLHHVHNLQSEVQNLNTTADSTGLTVSSINEGMKTLTTSQDETQNKIDHLLELQQAKEEANRAMRLVLQETMKTSAWMKKRDRTILRLRKQVEMLSKAAASLTPEDLLEILGVSADSAIQDLRRIRRASQATELSTDHIAQGIIEGRKFRDWLSSGDSPILFVEGGSSSTLHGRHTPVSLMSSVIVDYLSDNEPAVAIYFFCGSHTSPRDPIQGPLGMMRSLICQLLHLFPMELDFISSRRYREQLETLNFHTLCDCFIKLVKRVPTDSVLFCIIDSICFFEKREWADSCRKVINDLQDLADDEGPNSVFKLLITSPVRSRIVGGTLPPECHVLVPADNSDGRDRPTEREIRMRTARRRPARVQENEIMRSLISFQIQRPDDEGQASPDFTSDTDTFLDSDFENVETL